MEIFPIISFKRRQNAFTKVTKVLEYSMCRLATAGQLQYHTFMLRVNNGKQW